MTAAVEAQGLAKTFGETTALDGVDLQVAEGSVLGLLGPNGAGKTTVVRILATLLRPDAGRGSVAGCDVRDDPAGVRAAIGLTGQYAAIDEYLTGRENLIMAAELSQMSGRESRCRADELLGQFDLEEAADRRAGEYSGGMARRLDLAVSLVARPPVLFLDEPTTGLDPRSRRGMWQVIRGLVDEGTTLLLTTQYLDEADALADRIALIDRGRLIAEGTADELKAEVGGDVLHVRTANASQAQAAVDAVRDVSEEAEVGDGAGADEGWIQVPFGDDASLVAAAVRRLDDAGIALADVEVRRPTLDQVFFALTEESGERAEAPHAENDDEERTAGGQGRAGANGGARASGGDGVREREKEPDREGTPGGRAVDERDAPRPASQARSPKARRSRGNAPRDAFVIARRNIRHLIRQPQLLVFVTVQPIMLVLLFNFVFGGAIGRAIESPGVAYIDYLLPGILLQAVAFGTTTTAVGMAEDLAKGIVDRFRSLPMARSAVLAGRAAADTVRVAFVVVLMTGVGLLLGYDFGAGPLEIAAAFGIAVGFGLAFSWISAVIGMLVTNPEAAQSAGFVWLFPLSFASSAFVPIETFDSWLRQFAEVNPITHFVDALRFLTLDVPAGGALVPTGNPVLLALAWIVGILAVFAPLAVVRYRRST